MTANDPAPSRFSGASCGAPSERQRSAAWRRLSAPLGVVGMLLALGGLGVGHASYLTGSKFPFEGCVTNTMYSPFYATLDDYQENPGKSTSQFCISLHVAPGCTPGKYRCCNTSINKLKLFPALGCRGSLSSVVLSGKTINRTVTSIYWEEHDGFDIVKVTPLMEWFNKAENIDGARICINLRKPCWTLPTLSFDGEVLEYALYDKKVNNYECCPVGLFDVPRDNDPPALTTSPAPKPSPSPSPKPSPSPSPKPSPSPSPKPSPSPSPKPSPSPSASPSPKRSRSPKPSPSPKRRRSPKPSR